MCEMCDKNKGEPESCVDCGKLICWDVQFSDDIMGRPYVTTSGDLRCSDCGPGYDEADEQDPIDYAEWHGTDGEDADADLHAVTTEQGDSI